jgi:hypothetical protein
MNSVVINIIVEGQTEQTFVRDVLAPQIAHKGIYLNASLLGRPGHKGGDVRFDRAKLDICHFLKQRNDTYISTMFDYFRIDHKWPGKEDVHQQIQNGTTLTATDKAKILETATHNEIVSNFPKFEPENRFVPYIEMHEFEALLFSDADILAKETGIDPTHIRKIIQEYSNPEEINDDPVKAPSKQLTALKSGYRKVAMGKTVSNAIGIQAIRKQCPNFDKWLTKLEQLKGFSGAKP